MQKTDLNVSPYYDDFDTTDDFHRVLFRPGFAVQARELTQLQSILQNQIEKFGTHMFKEGAMVIPGQTGFTNEYYAVKLQSTFNSNAVSGYAADYVWVKQSLVQHLVLKQRLWVMKVQPKLTHLLFM